MRWLRAFGFLVLAAALAGNALAQTKDFSIPAGDLRAALDAFVRQSGMQLVYRADEVIAVQSKGATGRLSNEEALGKVLDGTGFTTVRDPSGAVAVVRTKGPPRPGEAVPRAAIQLEGIMVTAQKRTELLTDVPVPVSAVDAQRLVDRNEVRLHEYYTRIPGLSLTLGAGSANAPILSIRGLSTGALGGFGSNPTVGAVVDDVPYGSSVSLGGGSFVPDLDPSDLARVEVLRGPQGTLYGAGSIGGLLKYVTIDPSTERFAGRVQAGLSNVHNGDEAGYGVRAAVNLPLAESLAVRVSGFNRRDPGYIDDPGLRAEGVNRGEFSGGRVSALWAPSAGSSVKLSAMAQRSETDGANLVMPALGDLQQSFVLPGLGGYTRDTQVYSAIANWSIGAAGLTSVTGYSINELKNSLDRTGAFGGFTNTAYGVRGAQFVETLKTDKFSQEFRLTFPSGPRVEWLIGAFYTKEDSEGIQDIEAVDPATGQSVGLPYHNPYKGSFSEAAAFADLTYQFTDTLDVQFGGRASQNKQKLSALFEGVFIPIFFGFPSGSTYPEETSKDRSFTYLVTPRLKINPAVMVYARLASGYRPGGPNPNSSTVGAPTHFDADTTMNYEIGTKGDLGRAVSFDASLYYIDWKDVQVQVSDPVTRFAYFVNAGKAKSAGLEVSLEVRPTSGMTLVGWIALSEAELTENLPPGPVVGRSGDRLPFASRVSGHLSLDYSFPLGMGPSAYVGGSVSYVGDRLGNFTAGARQSYPAYTQGDIRGGFRSRSWSVDFYLRNVADKRGLLAGGLGTTPNTAFQVIQPRTGGVSVTYSF